MYYIFFVYIPVLSLECIFRGEYDWQEKQPVPRPRSGMGARSYREASWLQGNGGGGREALRPGWTSRHCISCIS